MRGIVPNDMSSTCVQGAIPRPLRGYQPIMERLSPEAAWLYQHSKIIPKQEPMDLEEKNDSGISGSDFQSSSPGSDHSDNMRYPSRSINSPMHHASYYPTPMTHQRYNGLSIPFHNDHQPLTPPSSEPMTSPKYLQSVTPTCSSTEDKSESNDVPQTTATPHTSPEENTPQACSLPMNGDALKQLQMSIEKNGLLPPSASPNPSESSKVYANKSDMDTDDCDDQNIYKPKVNSHGKVKQHKCKHCAFVAITKSDYWHHLRRHIHPEKLLECKLCPFVSDLKHHFEYHLNNHYGKKDFKCTECNYECNNKSMLNSHLKSHSDIYQYSCADCRYITKYIHSLKQHLRKYSHSPAMVRDPDGTPNPLPIIDVYGTRRGPKIKYQKRKTVEDPPQPAPPEPTTSFPFNQFMLNTSQMQLPFAQMPFFAGFPAAAVANPYILQSLESLIRQNQTSPRENQNPSLAEENDEKQFQQVQAEAEVLDLSKAPERPVQRNRRKGRAFKLAPTHTNGSDNEEEITTMFSNVEVVDNALAEISTREETSDENEKVENNNCKDNYSCQFCIINFGDPVLYTMHMGYHGFQNPFACNMCGEVCKDRVSFFLHIARTPHS